MTSQTQQNGTELLNADYLFLVRTEHFGTVGVGVGDGGRWVGMARVETGNEQGLVMLLGEKKPESRYLTASLGRVVQIPGSPTSVLATIVEQAYSRSVDLQSGKAPPAIESMLSQVPDAKERQAMRAKMMGVEATLLASLLLKYGIEAGVVEPNYLENFNKHLSGWTRGDEKNDIDR